MRDARHPASDAAERSFRRDEFLSTLALLQSGRSLSPGDLHAVRLCDARIETGQLQAGPAAEWSRKLATLAAQAVTPCVIRYRRATCCGRRHGLG
ncbi:MAG: hypothetical protein ACTIJY_07085 [Luteimonas sp.]